MKCLLVCSVCLLFGFVVLNAQDFEHYKAARCSGEIPPDFLQWGSEKANDAIVDVHSRDLSRKERMQEVTYEVSANFLTGEMLSSGQILYGDPMTVYVNKVADVLLESEPELRKELRFYVLRSYVPNAYATHTGVILISIGLLARVENEAQIACILAHEIQHYVKKHSLQQYKKNAELSRKINRIKSSELESRLKEMYRFSKEAETEADVLGYELLRKTKYDLKEGIAVFDMLRYTEYPFLEISLTSDSFETEFYHLPEKLKEEIKKYLLKNNKEDEGEEEEEDEETSTHPSLNKRIEKINGLLSEEKDTSNRVLRYQSESAFTSMQRMVRCELLLMHLRRGDYGKALYLSRVMELVYGKTGFTTEVEAMCWYGLTVHKAWYHDMNDYAGSIYRSYGDWQPFMAMIKKMRNKEMVALGIYQLYELARESNSKKIAEMRDHAFMLAQKETDIKLRYFLEYTPKTNAQVVDTGVKSDAVPAVRNPRSRNTGTGKTSDNTVQLDYFYALFYHLQGNDSLKKYFTAVEYEEPERTKTDYKKKKTKKEKSPNPINSIALFEPVYNEYLIDGDGDWSNDYYYEEKIKRKLMVQLVELGDKCDVPVTIVKNSGNAQMTTELVNRYITLNDWFLERLNNDTNSMVLWNRELAADEMANMGSQYLGWVGLKYSEEKRAFEPIAMVASILFFPVLPYYVIWQFGSNKKFSYLSALYDTRTAGMVSVTANSYNHKNRTDFVRAHLYRILYEIKNN